MCSLNIKDNESKRSKRMLIQRHLATSHLDNWVTSLAKPADHLHFMGRVHHGNGAWALVILGSWSWWATSHKPLDHTSLPMAISWLPWKTFLCSNAFTLFVKEWYVWDLVINYVHHNTGAKKKKKISLQVFVRAMYYYLQPNGIWSGCQVFFK